MNILQEYMSGEIYTRHAVDEKPDDRDFRMHIHEQCEVFLFISGDAEYMVEGSAYMLRPYDLVITRPAESHRIRIVNRVRYERYAVNFPPAVIEKMDPQRRLLRAFSDRPPGKNNFISSERTDRPLIERVFRNMCLCQGDDYERLLKFRVSLFMLLDMIDDLQKGITLSDHSAPTLPEQIIAYVNLHLTEKITVPLLAEHFFLSPSQFSRIFRQAAGVPPWEYITLKRLTAAKEMIRGGATVQQAAEDCGFREYSSFYRAYKKYFGCPPKKTGSSTAAELYFANRKTD